MATLQLYGKVGANFLGGEVAGDTFAVDYLSDVIKATLHTATYTPNIDTDELYADATNELATANGYTNGGLTLASKTVVYNATGNITTISCAAFSWTAAGGSIAFRYLVLRDSTVASGPLIGFVDCGAQTIVDTQSFTVTPGANGLFQATVT